MSNGKYKRMRPMPTATVLRESALPVSCPLREPDAMRAYRAAIKAGSELSMHSKQFLAPKGQGELGQWIRGLLAQSRVVFQPWSMEILFVAGVLDTVRFSTLEQVLGTSSKTIANKLRGLVKAGLLERRVEAGPPTLVTYRLTKHGRATAAVSSALFAHLNLAALGRMP